MKPSDSKFHEFTFHTSLSGQSLVTAVTCLVTIASLDLLERKHTREVIAYAITPVRANYRFSNQVHTRWEGGKNIEYLKEGIQESERICTRNWFLKDIGSTPGNGKDCSRDGSRPATCQPPSVNTEPAVPARSAHSLRSTSHQSAAIFWATQLA